MDEDWELEGKYHGLNGEDLGPKVEIWWLEDEVLVLEFKDENWSSRMRSEGSRTKSGSLRTRS